MYIFVYSKLKTATLKNTHKDSERASKQNIGNSHNG